MSQVELSWAELGELIWVGRKTLQILYLTKFEIQEKSIYITTENSTIKTKMYQRDIQSLDEFTDSATKIKSKKPN